MRRYAKYQAERVAQDRAEYLAGITHQMRSPLSALALSVQLLEQTEHPVDSEALDRLRRNVRRLRLLIDSVMRLERFKPHELPVNPSVVRPARLIDELVSDLEPEAARKGLRLEVHVNWTLRMTIDPELFRDALENLVTNAIKYTSSGSVRIDVVEQANHVLFEVRDTGPGIAPERQKQLFTPVQPQKAGGAGIGLTVVCRAVIAQGGQAGVDSEPGKGSRFWFRLPRTVGDPVSR